MIRMEDIDSRAVLIIKTLFDSEDYISSFFIADKAGISERTFFRLLPQIEFYIEKFNLKINRIRGKGFLLVGEKSDKNALIEKLVSNNSSDAFSQKEKSLLLFFSLLTKKSITKLSFLSSKLKLSESTISKILTDLENSFIGTGCTISRKPGVGTCIDGEEIDIRIFALKNACLYLDPNEFMTLLYNFIYNENSKMQFYSFTSTVFNFFRKRIDMKRLFIFTENLERIVGYEFSDIDFFVIFFYLAVAKMRCVNGFHIQEYHFELNDKTIEGKYKNIAEYLQYFFYCSPLSKTHVYESAFLFISILNTETMNIIDDWEKYESVARGFMSLVENNFNGYITSTKRAEYLLYQNILHVVNQYRKIFSTDKNINYLFDFQHVQYASSEINTFMPTAKQYLEHNLAMELSDEIVHSFLAICFLFLKKKKQNFSVALVCVTGILVSSILAKQIKMRFPEFKIIETVSLRKLTDDYIKEKKIDFVISTIGIQKLSVPIIQITVPLKADDITHIKNFIIHFEERKFLY
ncbi:hypothetical protein HMPREF9554_01987 [Treponema phagedenis F0421]|nr:hypothetical protein HMPREF9554_01987 [Treponema phagedenis F0421]TYT77927.1 hypothetical protein FS559_01690 [Treponema phagedenis]